VLLWAAGQNHNYRYHNRCPTTMTGTFTTTPAAAIMSS